MKRLFGRDRFRYEPDSNVYRCPAGSESLTWRFRSVEDGRTLYNNWSSACPHCPIKTQCTQGVQRRIKRWEHEAVLDAMQARLDAHPETMRVRTEMSLHVLAYNLKRMMAIPGPQPLMVALRACFHRKLPPWAVLREFNSRCSDVRDQICGSDYDQLPAPQPALTI